MGSNKSIRMAFVNMRHTACALRQRIVTKVERQMCDEIIDQADFWAAMLEEGVTINWNAAERELNDETPAGG